MNSREDAVVITYTPPNSHAQREVFEPRNGGGWERIEYERRDGQWCFRGSEIVANVSIETKDGGTNSQRGP